MTAETPGPGGIATVRHGWHLGETGGVRLFARGFDRALTGGPAFHYTALDVHLGRRLSRPLDVALVGTNLTGANRIEFQSTVANTVPARVQRTLLASATWRF